MGVPQFLHEMTISFVGVSGTFRVHRISPNLELPTEAILLVEVAPALALRIINNG
jgi:hypothetical protein